MKATGVGGFSVPRAELDSAATREIRPKACDQPPAPLVTAHLRRPAAALSLLTPQARAEHVLATVHAGLADIGPRGVEAKLRAISESPFRFFRGTAALFYADLEGTDVNLPSVLLNGDVHPENFGVLQRNDGALLYSLDDFDEAHRGPFSWDVRRGAVGFELAARAHGLDRGEREEVVHAFVDGYTDALRRLEHGKKERPLTLEDSPKLVRKLLEEAANETRAELLEARVDLATGSFLDTEELEPRPDLVAQMQDALTRYWETLEEAPGRPEFLRVKDVAAKLGSGTGSLGRPRYYALIEGPGGDGHDDVILELKAQGASVLAPFVGLDAIGVRSEAGRVVDAQAHQVEGGVRLYGHTTLGGTSYLVRERSPHKKRFDLEDMSAKQLRTFARIAGGVVAQAHVPDGDADVAEALRRSIRVKAFEREIEAFAPKVADRVEADHAHLVRALEV